MPAPRRFLLVCLVLTFPSLTAAQDVDCAPARFAEELEAPSVVFNLSTLERPEGWSDLGWQALLELPNTYAPVTPQRVADLLRSERIFGSLISEWNEAVTREDAQLAIVQEIQKQNSITLGHVASLLNFLSHSYDVLDPEQAHLVGHLVNPAIAEVNPRLARVLCQDLGLPMELLSEVTGQAADTNDWGMIDRQAANIIDRVRPQAGGEASLGEGARGVPHAITGLDESIFGAGYPDVRDKEDQQNPFHSEKGRAERCVNMNCVLPAALSIGETLADDADISWLDTLGIGDAASEFIQCVEECRDKAIDWACQAGECPETPIEVEEENPNSDAGGTLVADNNGNNSGEDTTAEENDDGTVDGSSGDAATSYSPQQDDGTGRPTTPLSPNDPLCQLEAKVDACEIGKEEAGNILECLGDPLKCEGVAFAPKASVSGNPGPAPQDRAWPTLEDDGQPVLDRSGVPLGGPSVIDKAYGIPFIERMLAEMSPDDVLTREQQDGMRALLDQQFVLDHFSSQIPVMRSMAGCNPDTGC